MPGSDDPDQMRRWEPVVRAAVIDFELVSNLRFTCDKGTAEAGLWHIEGAPGGLTAKELVTLKRPGTDVFEAQTAVLLEGDTELRRDRGVEILTQLGYPEAFWTSLCDLHPDRTGKSFELLGAALRLAKFVEMRFKHAFACPRPAAYSRQIQPMILTPGHGSLPSGHATEAFMTARVLEALLAPGGDAVLHEQLMRQAARIAINRQIAGVHFPVDSAAGQVLGLALGDYFVACCRGEVEVRHRRFDGTAFDGDGDFDWRDIEKSVPHFELGSTGPTPGVLPGLQWLWREAAGEWPGSQSPRGVAP
jgi:hypothetical protein